MKNIYFAAALAVLAFSACSNDTISQPSELSSSSSDTSSDISSSSVAIVPSSSSSDISSNISSSSSVAIVPSSSSSDISSNISSSSSVAIAPSSSSLAPSSSSSASVIVPSSSSIVSSSSSNSGSSSKSGACYFTFTMRPNFGDMCAEGKIESITASDCDEMLADMDEDPETAGMYTVKFQDSCPSGQQLKCDVDGEGFIYLYGLMFLGSTCESFDF